MGTKNIKGRMSFSPPPTFITFPLLAIRPRNPQDPVNGVRAHWIIGGTGDGRGCCAGHWTKGKGRKGHEESSAARRDPLAQSYTWHRPHRRAWALRRLPVPHTAGLVLALLLTLLHPSYASLFLYHSSTAFQYRAINNKHAYSIKKLKLVVISQFGAGFPVHATLTGCNAAQATFSSGFLAHPYFARLLPLSISPPAAHMFRLSQTSLLHVHPKHSLKNYHLSIA